MAEAGAGDEGDEGDEGERSEGTDAVTDRVLRWLSAISLVLLVLVAAWHLGLVPSFPVHLPIVTAIGPEYILSYLLLPATATAVCDVTGVATFVVSMQRKQWTWFVGALICLVVHFYSGLALSFPAGIAFLYRLAGSAFALTNYVTLYDVLALTPIVVLAFAYAWTRRQPPSASTAG